MVHLSLKEGGCLSSLEKPSGLFSLKPPKELSSWGPNWGQRLNSTLGWCKLWVVDTGAESRGKGVVGSPHPKARFVPKGTGLRTRWGMGVG